MKSYSEVLAKIEEVEIVVAAEDDNEDSVMSEVLWALKDIADDSEENMRSEEGVFALIEQIEDGMFATSGNQLNLMKAADYVYCWWTSK